jgi:hypothetical protein
VRWTTDIVPCIGVAVKVKVVGAVIGVPRDVIVKLPFAVGGFGLQQTKSVSNFDSNLNPELRFAGVRGVGTNEEVIQPPGQVVHEPPSGKIPQRNQSGCDSVQMIARLHEGLVVGARTFEAQLSI